MPTIEDLCSWKRADTKKTLERLKLAKLFAAHGIGASAEDLFGEAPATYVHKGNVKHRGPVLCDARGHGIYIIEGSLAIDGAFTYYTADAYTILVITGDLTAKDLSQAWDTQLVVLGTTTIAGVLCIDVSDAGFALFRGAVTSRERRIVNTSVASDVPMFAKKPKGSVPEGWSGPSEPADLHAALVRGDKLFTPAPKGVKKPPRDAALKKMSIAEVLTVTGFEKMQFEGETVNPNWFAKGTPGCALASLTLARAYLDAFPTELASLTELILLALDDDKRLAAMLRSLPTLRSLKRLRISGCALGQIELAALEQLEALELDTNKPLKKLPIAEINKLAKLRKLVVTGNAITSLTGLDLDRIPEVQVREKPLELWRP